jgi:hypothetical protein
VRAGGKGEADPLSTALLVAAGEWGDIKKPRSGEEEEDEDEDRAPGPPPGARAELLDLFTNDARSSLTLMHESEHTAAITLRGGGLAFDILLLLPPDPMRLILLPLLLLWLDEGAQNTCRSVIRNSSPPCGGDSICC